MGEFITSHVTTNNNPVYLCNKIIEHGQKRDHLVFLVIYNLYD